MIHNQLRIEIGGKTYTPLLHKLSGVGVGTFAIPTPDNLALGLCTFSFFRGGEWLVYFEGIIRQSTRINADITHIIADETAVLLGKYAVRFAFRNISLDSIRQSIADTCGIALSAKPTQQDRIVHDFQITGTALEAWRAWLQLYYGDKPHFWQQSSMGVVCAAEQVKQEAISIASSIIEQKKNYFCFLALSRLRPGKRVRIGGKTMRVEQIYFIDGYQYLPISTTISTSLP